MNKVLTFPVSDLITNDTNNYSNILTVTGVAATADTHGTVTLSDGQVAYTPAKNYSGPASFSFTVKDSRGRVGTANVNITINPGPINTAPVIVSDNL